MPSWGPLNEANYFFLNDGTGSFPVSGQIDPVDYDTCSVQLGDVDGDGDVDLVVGNNGQHNFVHLNQGLIDTSVSRYSQHNGDCGR